LTYFQNEAWPSAILIFRWSAHARPILTEAVELKAWVHILQYCFRKLLII